MRNWPRRIGHEEVVPVPKILRSIICVLKIEIVLGKMNSKIQNYEIQLSKIANTIQ